MRTTEIDLAKRYVCGDCNEIQLNYIILENKFDRNKIELLISYYRNVEPFYVACKLLLGFLIFNHVFSAICTLLHLLEK